MYHCSIDIVVFIGCVLIALACVVCAEYVTQIETHYYLFGTLACMFFFMSCFPGASIAYRIYQYYYTNNYHKMEPMEDLSHKDSLIINEESNE